jgi:hypothetical protein
VNDSVRVAHCKGCGVEVTWALNVTSGKKAPLVKAKEGEKPNVILFLQGGEPHYRISYEPVGELGEPLYVNHLSNCPKAGEFKSKKTEEPHA